MRGEDLSDCLRWAAASFHRDPDPHDLMGAGTKLIHHAADLPFGRGFGRSQGLPDQSLAPEEVDIGGGVVGLPGDARLLEIEPAAVNDGR
jgi:hypothetical protein